MSHSVYEYRPLKGLGPALVILLYIFIALNVFGVMSDYMEVELLSKFIEGEFVSDETIASNDTRQALVGFSHLGILIVLYFVFGKWIYRASANAHVLAPSFMTHTPGWAVGSYFIPILNLIRPYEAMKETWQVSATQKGQEPADVTTPGILRLWWAAWLISRFTGTAVFYVLKESDEVEQYIVADQLSMADSAVTILLSLDAIGMVKRLTKIQTERGEVPLDGEGVLACDECGEAIDASSEDCPMCGASIRSPQLEFEY
jgi:hypothetical protein